MLQTLKDQEGLLNLDIMWATIGQNIDDVTGVLQHILLNRLETSIINADSAQWQSPLYPKVTIEALQPDLTLRALRPFFIAGAKPALNLARFHQLKRHIAFCFITDKQFETAIGRRMADYCPQLLQ